MDLGIFREIAQRPVLKRRKGPSATTAASMGISREIAPRVNTRRRRKTTAPEQRLQAARVSLRTVHRKKWLLVERAKETKDTKQHGIAHCEYNIE